MTKTIASQNQPEITFISAGKRSFRVWQHPLGYWQTEKQNKNGFWLCCNVSNSLEDAVTKVTAK